MNLQKPIRIAVNRTTKMVLIEGPFPRAAAILGRYLEKITGAHFAVNPVECILPSFVFAKHHPKEDEEPLGESGFIYRIFDKDIRFEAETEQAAVYAVYDFLERVVGCRYFTSSEEYVPYDANLTVCFKETRMVPILDFREVYYWDFEDPAFAEKHKMAPSKQHQGWGFWCHSFQNLVPAEEFFDSHPEYFSLREGKRIGKNSQLCLSNPEVFDLLVRRLRIEVEKHPEAKYWSVSQNDNDAYCECEECRRLNEEDGSPMGSVLRFVNRVAAEFPDKIISTLAYWYTRTAPKLTRPDENVHIMLCNIEANRGLPIEVDPRSVSSKQELLDWKEICDHLFLWDYCVQFRNLVSPFPNLRVLAPNIRFFVENHVRALFSQCNGLRGGEFSALRGYLLAKLMWEPDRDSEEIIREFLDGYYKQAAPFILRYIDRMQAVSEESGGELNIFGGPLDAADTYLAPALLAEYDRLFDEAEAAVSADSELLFRVRTARLSLQYAEICLDYGTVEERLARIASFAAQARRTGLEMVEERDITLDRFVTDELARLAGQKGW